MDSLAISRRQATMRGMSMVRACFDADGRAFDGGLEEGARIGAGEVAEGVEGEVGDGVFGADGFEGGDDFFAGQAGLEIDAGPRVNWRGWLASGQRGSRWQKARSSLMISQAPAW
jgi:hypothetical protein